MGFQPGSRGSAPCLCWRRFNGQDFPRIPGVMRTREILPGAAIAAMLTASALLALLVALGMRGDGPLALGLGGSDGSARLSGGEGGGAAATGVGGRKPA